MGKIGFIAVFITLALTIGCNGKQTDAVDPDVTSPIAAPVQQDVIEPAQTPLPPSETAAPNCLGDEINLIGKSIADEYESASYEQVMTWFCNGAEFEDILVALETESQTGRLADELLVMMAEGLSWEEIWQVIGFTD